MPPPSTSDAPRLKMPLWRVVLSYGFAALFDLLKFIFDLFVFTAPVIIGYAASAAASSSWWLSWIPSALITSGVSLLAGAAQVFLPPIAVAVEVFGLIMAMAVSLLGTLFFSLWFLFAGVNPYGARRLLKTLMGLGVGFVPFLNLFPTFTMTVWLVVRQARKEDRAARAAWERAQEELRSAQIAQAAALLPPAQAAALAARMQAARANDEIPESQPLAA